MIFLILFNILSISNISIDENNIEIEASINLNEDSISKGVYVLSGELIKENKKIGLVRRFSRIYFPCKKGICNYSFQIEIGFDKIEKKDLIDFILKKGYFLNITLKEINSKKEIKLNLPFSYDFKGEISENMDLNLIKIEDLIVYLKEKPSIKFNLILINPFLFNIQIKEAKITFEIENQKIENNFNLNEEIGKGEKSFPLEIPIKSDLLFYILSKKFLKEDFSAKISGNYNGKIKFMIDEYSFEISFSK